MFALIAAPAGLPFLGIAIAGTLLGVGVIVVGALLLKAVYFEQRSVDARVDFISAMLGERKRPSMPTPGVLLRSGPESTVLVAEF